MKHFANNSNSDSHALGVLLTPSWASTITGIVISIGFVTFVIVSTFFKGSTLRQQLLDFSSSHSAASAQTISRTLDKNAFISNLPLFLFWCLVGFVIYMFAINIYGVVQHTAEVLDELNNNVHIDRRQLIRESFEKLGLQITVAIIWVAYIVAFFHYIIPYVIVLCLAAADNLLSLVSLGSLFLAVIILLLGLHVHTLLLRLLMLRTRLFGGTL